MKKVTTPIEELDRDRRRGRTADLGCQPIISVAPRSRARLSGEVKSVRIVPRSGAPTLEVIIDDGHGKATAVFFGRRHLAGITPGRHVVVEGMTLPDRHRIVLYNPAYTLL